MPGGSICSAYSGYLRSSQHSTSSLLPVLLVFGIGKKAHLIKKVTRYREAIGEHLGTI
jgi:hypothetical protein